MNAPPEPAPGQPVLEVSLRMVSVFVTIVQARRCGMNARPSTMAIPASKASLDRASRPFDNARPSDRRGSPKGLPMSHVSHAELARTIDDAFERRDGIGPATKGPAREAVDAALELLDSGQARVAEKTGNGSWRVNQWLKKAVLLSFRLNDMTVIPGGPGDAVWWDKVASKFDGWDEARFRAGGFRAVPGAVVRRSAYIAPGVVLMPCFVNLGACVDEGTVLASWSTVGSCGRLCRSSDSSGAVGVG